MRNPSTCTKAGGSPRKLKIVFIVIIVVVGIASKIPSFADVSLASYGSSATLKVNGMNCNATYDSNVLSNDTSGFAAAVAAAKTAEQVVLYLGIDGSVEGEGKDRHFVGLPPTQVALAKAVLEACGGSKPVVVILINGGQLAIDWLADNAPAIIEAWYPGIYGGEAVADALFGKNRFG